MMNNSNAFLKDVQCIYFKNAKQRGIFMQMNDITSCWSSGVFSWFPSVHIIVGEKSGDSENIKHGIFNMTHLRRIVLGVNSSSLRHDSNSLTGFIWSTMFIRNLQVLHDGCLNFFPFYQAYASTTHPFTHDFNTCIVQKKGTHKTDNDSTWHHLSYKLAYPRTCQSTLLFVVNSSVCALDSSPAVPYIALYQLDSFPMSSASDFNRGHFSILLNAVWRALIKLHFLSTEHFVCTRHGTRRF